MSNASPASNQDLQQAMQELPLQTVEGSGPRVRQLASLIDGDLPLQMFLERLLPELSELFSGDAAVIWMRAEGASGAVFGVRYRMDQLLNTVAEQKKHERLVQLAWQQKKTLLAEPAARRRSPPAGGDETPTPADSGTVKPAESSPPTGGATFQATHNPTGRPLLFGPILHMGEPVALLEVVLSESGPQLSPAKRKLYLRGIQLVAERVYGGLRRRMTLPTATIANATEHLALLTGEVESLQQQIVRNIENKLQKLHSWGFSTLAENQAFAKMVHQLLDGHGLRVRCPECGHAAILRCLRAGNAKNGVFVFDHYLDTGRTFHGGSTTVPLIQVVKKPARRTATTNQPA